nr:pyruvate formate lyase family protein [uncultured Flavobacterium sp.]
MQKIDDFSMELNFTEAYRKNSDKHIAIREAKCHAAQFPAVLSEIQDNDRLAGRTFWGWVGFSPHNAPGGAAYGYFCHEQKIIEALERGNIPIEQRDGVHEMLHFWKTETSKAKVEAAFTEKMLPVLFRDEIVSLPYNFKPLIANPIYRMAGVFVDYEKLLRLGIPGLIDEIAECRDKAKASNGDHELYEGMLMALDVFIYSCHHYEMQAIEKANATTNPKRKNELLLLADVLKKNTLRKPESFYEALQLSWLYTLICGSLELGRVDIYLGDFYVNDIDNGVITEDEALSLMHSYWKLINDLFRDVDGRVIIGGRGRRNEKNADRFALLVLETMRTYGRAILPQTTLRFYEGMNPELMEKSISLIGDGHTFPLLYNDDVLVPGVAAAHDVPLEDAEQYMPLGCGEITIDHMGFGTPSGSLNVLKALDVTLRNGVDHITGKQLGLATGELKDFKTFDEFFDAFKKQLAFFIEILADHEDLEYVESAKHAPYLYLSMLYDDCIARGKAIFDGGIRYLGGSLESFGSVNSADSLTAIKKMVFDEKLISPEQLMAALNNNFVGYEKEHKLLKDSPKYGNDDDYADAIMVELHDFMCNTIRDQRERTNLDWYLNVLINNKQNTILGRWVGASADGRKAGREMANANTPSGGNDKKGVTALINSLVKPSHKIHAGTVQNMRFGRDFFTADRPRFEFLLDTYFKKGGAQAMITVINRGDLENALVEPEKHQDLFVRIGGFSARYIDLPRDVQLEILSRVTY